MENFITSTHNYVKSSLVEQRKYCYIVVTPTLKWMKHGTWRSINEQQYLMFYPWLKE